MEKTNSTILDKIRNIIGLEVVNEIEETTDVVELEEVVEPVAEPTEDTPDEPIIVSQSTLEDGTIIYYIGEIGAEVVIFTDEIMETILVEGEYVLENGDKFTIVNGVVGEYIPIVADEIVDEKPEVEALEEINYEELYNKLKTIMDELKKQLETFSKQEIALKDQIEKLENEPEAESVTQRPQDTIEMTAIEKRLAALDSIRKLRQK
jgi:hypothetical protein